MTSSDTSEGTVQPNNVTFTPANWNVPQTVTVRGVNDNQSDGNIMFSIITGAATSNDPAYSGLNPADVSVTNIDNDTPQVYVRTRPLLTVSENGTTAIFRIGLTMQPSASVTCTLFSTDPMEGAVSPSNIVFTRELECARHYRARPRRPRARRRRRLPDHHERMTSADPAYNGQNPRDVNVVNRDND